MIGLAVAACRQIICVADADMKSRETAFVSNIVVSSRFGI